MNKNTIHQLACLSLMRIGKATPSLEEIEAEEKIITEKIMTSNIFIENFNTIMQLKGLLIFLDIYKTESIIPQDK